MYIQISSISPSYTVYNIYRGGGLTAYSLLSHFKFKFTGQIAERVTRVSCVILIIDLSGEKRARNREKKHPNEISINNFHSI